MRTVRTVLLALALVTAGGLAYLAAGAERHLAPAAVIPRPTTWSCADLSIAWLGHASVLIDFGGTLLLTDPAFFDRVGVQVGPVTIGPKRLVASALTAADLPRLDAVLVSHAHMDSLDRPSLRATKHARQLVVPERTRDLVDDLGFPAVTELGWGQQVRVGDVDIEAIELRHWGKRWPWERWRGYNGYLLRKGDTVVFLASDTAYTDAVAHLGQKHSISVVIMGNGAYDPWIRNHANPEQVWRMFVDSGARYLIPIHWDTFRLGKEPLGEAIARLRAAAGADGNRIVIQRIGETWTVPCCACRDDVRGSDATPPG